MNKLSKRFISATKEYSDLYTCVPSPYIRKAFTVKKKISSAVLSVCGLGFYRLWINGSEKTKGHLSPYISNPDKVMDYDLYDLGGILNEGKNALAFQLGNGMQNAFGGYVWDFERAEFRSAPKLACCLHIEYDDGSQEDIESDESFLCHPSPLICDDLRMGEIYDANELIEGWNEVDFDDSSWAPAILAETPKGEQVICRANPITLREELKPISISFGKWIPGRTRTHHYGYLYDFGVNTAGITHLKIKAKKGQRIVITFGEILKDDCFHTDNIAFIRPDFPNYSDYVQQITYIANGEGIEEYEQSFTYHGFRYAFVEGITEEQATEELLTYKVMNTALAERGGFSCSCDKLNRLQEMTRRSTLSNFWHFPNDCPHREKNGWTADAALSAEQTLLNFDPYNNYFEWMRHVRGAMNEQGALPGVVPTCGYGFVWGNGPAWDQVLVELPYMSYRYRGKKEIVEENIDAALRYIHYLETRRDENGLLAIGLGDWCAPFGIRSPLIFTDSVMAKSICEKAAFMARLCGRQEDAEYCEDMASEFRKSIRAHLLDLDTGIAVGDCQTSQALALYYGIVEGEEIEKAYSALLSFIEREKGHLDTGVIGARVIFHVLSDHGDADLAYKMLVEPTPPSYGYWLEKGYTALAEDLWTDEQQINSKNHHFWGDISAFFIKDICGIDYNPELSDLSYVKIKPAFIAALDNASAYHDCPRGRIMSEWERKGENVILKISVPESMRFDIELPEGYRELSRQVRSDELILTLV